MITRIVGLRSWVVTASIVTGAVAALSPVLAEPPLLDTTANSTRIIYRPTSPPSQNGARPTIDVFWCSGDDKASNRELAASELAASYGTVARLGLSRAASDIGEIRTRPIAKDTFLANFDQNDANTARDRALIRFDAKDANLKKVVDSVVMKGLRPAAVSLATSSAYVPNYVSVYVCPDLDPSALVGRIFFQVKDAKQKDEAKRAAAAISTELPGLSVANSIEVVGADAPPNSELRYFFETDAGLAARTAREISHATSTKVVAKRVVGFEEKLRRGTLEAWISE
jgi:hypothetical protein